MSAKKKPTRQARPTLQSILAGYQKLHRQLCRLTYPAPVAHVYHPLAYASAMHEAYWQRYGQHSRPLLLLGMNPGPFGMVQTGIPFGSVSVVQQWLQMDEKIVPPKYQHPKRPILGLSCLRQEVSGQRLWGYAQTHHKTPQAFFKYFFVLNYCPVAFMEESGKNFTPDKLPIDVRQKVFAACDEVLRQAVCYFQAKWVIGVGIFAQQRAEEALRGVDVGVGRILHPSPQSPMANRGFIQEAAKQLQPFLKEVV